MTESDPFIPEEVEVHRVDRSTLENWGDTDACPHREALKRVYALDTVGKPAHVGEHIHRVLGAATRAYIEDPDRLLKQVQDWRDFLMSEVSCSQDDDLPVVRMDVLSEATAILEKMAWGWARFITRIHPESIRAFDGGEGNLDGQLHRDLVIGQKTFRVTSEVDLLFETHNPERLEEVDYKTGWKNFDSNTVYHSFQFQLHAWLVFSIFPEVNELVVRIWSPQRFEANPTLFRRRDLETFAVRVRAALDNWFFWSGQPVERTPPLPSTEKCALCDASIYCHAASRPFVQLHANPGVLLGEMIAAQAKVDAIRDHLWGLVQETGEDVVFVPTGQAFGLGKPKRVTKRSAGVYKVGQSESE